MDEERAVKEKSTQGEKKELKGKRGLIPYDIVNIFEKILIKN
jgi:hypothetical protein